MTAALETIQQIAMTDLIPFEDLSIGSNDLVNDTFDMRHITMLRTTSSDVH